jgi:hypothetical protein
MNAKELLGKRRLVFRTNQMQSSKYNPGDFKRFVELASEYGATHIYVGNLPFKYDSWVLPDRSDPYAAWCNTASSLFRVCPPQELHEWLPKEYAEKVQQFLKGQLEIMRPFGLKGRIYTVEPLWLPEGVYRCHPEWRGAQCELGRIARNPYFAPSIDEPEVLELYRKSVRQFASLFPEIDELDFMSNDSGAGISWSPLIYPGMNGPVKYRKKDGGARIVNWMKALQDGACESGVEMRICLHYSGMSPETVESAKSKLRPGLFIQWQGVENETWSKTEAGFGGGVWNMCYPIIGSGNPLSFLRKLQDVYCNNDDDATTVGVSFNETDIVFVRKMLEAFMAFPGSSYCHYAQTVSAVAEKMTGNPKLAEELIKVWETMDAAVHALAQIRQKGFGNVLSFVGVSMRWIIRPLVPEPDKLTEVEKDYYLKNMFSTGTDKQNTSFNYVLGKGVFSGSNVTWMARWCLNEAACRFKQAQTQLKKVADGISDKDLAAEMTLYSERIGVISCFAENIKNCIMYQYALDTAFQPQFGPNLMDYDDNMTLDFRASNLRKIAREELDNTVELVRLLEHSCGPLVETADTPGDESVFMLGPDFAGDLKKKMEIMLSHWQDYERLYPTCRVWDFEPELRGNFQT